MARKTVKILINWKSEKNISLKVNVIISKLVFLKSTITEPHKNMLFAVLVNIYKIRMHQSITTQYKIAVFLNLLHFFEIKFYV